jgi:hypothetical protein
MTKWRRMIWVGHRARMGTGEAYTRFWWGKRALGRPRRRWEDKIKMDVQEIGCGGVDWNELAEDKDRWRAELKVVMNLRVP